ncbi:unnamed protein product [Ceutorhynchus assimilis]|uniref:EGF-like domain-containing protein n=1 Tax=Ceutorhynchus assimilis TaxID=467358 RepID=A0A9P0DKJ3_9CUCU|nr:unnamed protein product [Ceutorhynchus assimilis]
MDYFKLFSVFFVIWSSANADQPEIYVHDNNLVVKASSTNFIQLIAGAVKINDVNLLPTLYTAQNATKLLRNYETFISQFNTKMDDMESRLVVIGTGIGQNATNISSVPSNFIITNIRRLSNKILLLQRSIRTLQALLTTDDCASNPCKNGGICFDIYNGFLCQCPTGWEGPACDIDINECARFIGTDLGCQNGGTCLNLPGTYQCQCPNTWIGVHCNRKKSDCNTGGSEICGHGTCISQNNEIGYKCLCDQGWTTDGVHMSCTIDVDECKQNHPPCSTNPLVQCINLPGSFTCQHCPPGYTGNGYYCADINECELFNGGCSVSPYAECFNTPGSRKCGPCPVGYEGDGKICTFKGVCNINNGGCSILARCVQNTAISDTYVQCICPAGYTGSGVGPAGCTRSSSTNVATITSCTPNPCVHGSCVSYGSNQSDASFTCVCDRSFTGILCDQKRDLCSPNPCLNGGTCQTRKGRFTCICPPGYVGRNCGRQRSACGDNLNSFNGTVSYPPSDFESSRGREALSCAWTITTDNDKVIQVNFTKFSFADAPCTTQWFQVHDGRNSLSPALGRFCGNTLPLNGSLTTTQNIIYFWLRTVAQSSKRPEFELSWTSKDPDCGGTLNQEGIGIITSPGWPNKYPNNRQCSWRFKVPSGKRLLFHVYTLDIGHDSECTGDYLEFYADGEYSTKRDDRKPELFAKLCNATIPEPFYSLFPSGYIKFKSNEKDTYQGFQIGYSIVDGIPGCGGTYTNKDGYIKSVELTRSMPSLLICQYEIKLLTSATIKLDIVEIDMDENCWDTYVAVYLKSETGTSLITKTCGSRLPGPIITYGKNVIIEAQSKYTHKNHWKIKYETACHQTYTAPVGTINTDSSTCNHLIQQPPGNIIILDIELGRHYQSFALDAVKIYDGDNENATLLGDYPRWIETKIKLESSTNYVLITTKQVVRTFSVKYSTLDLGCGGLMKNDLGTGTISYPPRNLETYSGNRKCRWVIMAPLQKVIQLTWITFNLEQSFDCSYDNVQVFDNNTGTEGMGGLLGKYCGFTLPPVMLSSSNIMTIDFTSDNTIHGDGFLVAYTFILEKNVCGGNYFTPAGVIKSPGFPQNYPTNRECIWTITVNPGSQIMLKFTNFTLESYSSCRYDWLEVRNGGTSSSPLIGKYCGNTYQKTIPSHTNKLYLKFNSDMSKTGPGFRIEWSSAATGCGGTLSSPSGSIMSPHYPEPYTKNTDCLWKITVSAGSKIQLIFADIDLEKHTTCGLDYIQLFDGSTINSKSLGKFCTLQTSPVLSTLNNMLVRFRSDVSFQGRGFNIQYSTICTNTMTGFRGVIESPNFPYDYPQDQNCIWDISVSEGNKINISFSHFALERSLTFENKSCAFDYVEIEYEKPTSVMDYNENDLTWKVYNRYCGDKNPGFITLDANHAKIHFVSDSLLLGTGFRLEWQLFGCGGILSNEKGTITSPNYPKPYPESIECNWLIKVPFGQSISIVFKEIDVEKDSSCSFDFISIYNGEDATYQELATFCHQLKPVTVTSSGNNMFVKFKTDYSYQGRGFKADYSTIPTTCGGLLTAPSGYIFSPNYPQNFNKNETCEWLIDVDENHLVDLQFENVDLIRTIDCQRNYIKVYDGPTQAYPLLKTICANTNNTNETIQSTYEHMFIEFRSDYYLTSKGFKAKYRKACGARIKTSGSGQIQLKNEFDFDEITTCTYTIEAEDKCEAYF